MTVGPVGECSFEVPKEGVWRSGIVIRAAAVYCVPTGVAFGVCGDG